MYMEAAYVSNEHGKKGYLVSGRIEGGVLRKGDKMITKPSDVELSIKVSFNLEN